MLPRRDFLRTTAAALAAPTVLRRRFPLAMSATIGGLPDRITVTMRIVPIGLDVLDDLVASEHLDAGVREVMPALDLLPFRNDDFSSTPELAATC